MLAFRFHTLSRYNPDPLTQVELIPVRIDHLVRAGRSQDDQFQRSRRYRIPNPQPLHERLDLVKREGRVMPSPTSAALREGLIKMRSRHLPDSHRRESQQP